MQGPEKSFATPRNAIGYVRVSTPMQADEGGSLDRQVQRLREWSEANGYRLTFIYQDVASAAGKNNLRHRPEFVQATREAVQSGVPLMVCDVSRASRNVETLDKLVIAPGLSIISVEDDGEVMVGIMRMRVGEAAEKAHRIAEGTRSALSTRTRRKPAGAETWHYRAAQASAARRTDNKDRALERVVDYLAQEPTLVDASSRLIAERLNQEGLRTGWGLLWSASSVRGKKAAIMEELALRLEQDQDQKEGSALHEDLASAAAPLVRPVDPVLQEACPARSDDADPLGQDEDPGGEARMRASRSFGMF